MHNFLLVFTSFSRLLEQFHTLADGDNLALTRRVKKRTVGELCTRVKRSWHNINSEIIAKSLKNGAFKHDIDVTIYEDSDSSSGTNENELMDGVFYSTEELHE